MLQKAVFIFPKLSFFRFCEPLQYADDHGLIALKPVEDESQKNIPEPLRPDP